MVFSFGFFVHAEHAENAAVSHTTAQTVGIPSLLDSDRGGRTALRFPQLITDNRSANEEFSGLGVTFENHMQNFPGCFVSTAEGVHTNWFESAVERTNTFSTQERDRWQLRTQGRANDLLTAFKRTGGGFQESIDALSRIAFRYPGTQAGNEAREILASTLLERGYFLEAALLFDSLPHPPPTLLMKSAMAWANVGDSEKARAIWNEIDKDELVRLLNREREENNPIDKEKLESFFRETITKGEGHGLSSSLEHLFQGYQSNRASSVNPSWITQCFNGSGLRHFIERNCALVKDSINHRFIQFAGRTRADSVSNSLSQTLLGSCQKPETQTFVTALREREQARLVLERLVQGLQNERPEMREETARILGTMGEAARPAVPALIAALRDRNANVRLQVVRSLGVLGEIAQESAPVLVEALRGSQPPEVLVAAARAIARMGEAGRRAISEKERIRFLVKGISARFQDANPIVRADTAHALGELGRQGKAAVPILTRVLRDSEGSVRAEAARALSQIGPEASEAVPALIKALKDSHAETRAMSAKALSSIGSATKIALPHLIEILTDTNAGVRVHALHALTSLGETAKEAVPHIARALRDTDSGVRIEAACGLSSMGRLAEGAVPELMHALKDSNGMVRLFAAEALGNIGRNAERSLPALRRLIENDPDVRVTAELAVNKILRRGN